MNRSKRKVCVYWSIFVHRIIRGRSFYFFLDPSWDSGEVYCWENSQFDLTQLSHLESIIPQVENAKEPALADVVQISW